MKINRVNNWVSFDTIKVGDVFIDLEQNDIYMKIEATCHDDEGNICNAVNLSDGTLIYVFEDKDYRVKPIKCEIIVNE